MREEVYNENKKNPVVLLYEYVVIICSFYKCYTLGFTHLFEDADKLIQNFSSLRVFYS